MNDFLLSHVDVFLSTAIEDLLSELEHDTPREERVENENFLVEEDEEDHVDAMLDSLFEDGDDEGSL